MAQRKPVALVPAVTNGIKNLFSPRRSSCKDGEGGGSSSSGRRGSVK